jgi:uncharacterized membrane protein
MTYIEHFILKQYCMYCMISAGLMLVILIFSLVGVAGYAFGSAEKKS